MSQGFIVRRSALTVSVGFVSIYVGFLASVFFAGVPICLLAGFGFVLWALLQVRVGAALKDCIEVAGWFLVLLAISLLIPNGIATFEVVKAGVGTSLFFLTLTLGPRALNEVAIVFPAALRVAAILVTLFFYLDFFSILSLKSLGIVGWFESDLIVSQFDVRPSGLFSEPSWHALAAGALAYYLSKGGGIANLVLCLGLVSSTLASGSAIGLAISALVLVRWWVLGSENLAVRAFAVSFLVVACVLAADFAIGSDFIPTGALGKLFDPLSSGSGQSRFLAPLYFIGFAFETSPFFGLGLSYISSELLGRMGAAVLPINVFIQTGFLGLMVYAYYLSRQCYRERSGMFDIAAVVLCSVSLGLEQSPFQALLIVFFITGWPKKRDLSRC
ncbi:hypothetical protein [Oceanicola sp. 502str15]|uniref:hypothetical protein n=1 Tax=Oceanicola sp. 502str15 TaxID=2696061 RepID=UPI00209592C2|nr:hypothetical protein [Oceanicola sp. 502str15]MCO6384612.1 hypothetical protein [Oceanicola sp. 502str15]